MKCKDGISLCGIDDLEGHKRDLAESLLANKNLTMEQYQWVQKNNLLKPGDEMIL